MLAALVASTLLVWPVDSLVKVFPDDAPGTNRVSSAAVPVARNGHASVQFAVRAGAPLEELEIQVRLGGGLKTEVRRVGYVPVRSNPKGSPADELVRKAPGRFPDPLFEGTAFRLEANETTAFWITIAAPASVAPGVYKGGVVFRSGKQKLAKAAFQVRVGHALVPARQALKVTNWLNFDEQWLAKYYAPERYWEVVGNIARVMGEHRQNVIFTPVFALTEARLDGSALAYDFSKLDRFIDIFSKAGAADLIEGEHLMGRASGYDSPLKLPAFVAENGAVKRVTLDPDDPRVEAHLDSFLPALYAHLKEKGWLGRYVQHVLDEAHGSEPPVYLRYVKIIRRNLPGVPTIDAIDQTAGLLGDACDIWVPQLGKFDDGFEAIREHVKKGGQAWYYTCLFPQSRHLNRFIDYPLLKTRLLHWFNYRYELTGFLHWGGNYWDADPYGNAEPAIENGTEVLPAGDAFITYPWREQASIHSSIRLEAMREGIEDYELLRALGEREPAKARRLAEQAIPNLTDYVRDVAAFRRLQAELVE